MFFFVVLFENFCLCLFFYFDFRGSEFIEVINVEILLVFEGFKVCNVFL